jgi:PAS domain S-box-containing protein
MNETQEGSAKPHRVLASMRLYVFLATVVLIGGAAATYLLARSEDARMRSELLIQARLIAGTLDLSMIEGLSGSEADLQSENYLVIKSRLTLLRSANPLCRFIYLTGMRAGAVFFYVDSESPESPDYSPPGQVYGEASKDFKGVFLTGEEFVEGPIPDRWGDWVSSLVPIVDPETAKPIAVLGMDMNAGDWTKKIMILCALPATLTILLAAVLTFLFVLFRRSEQARWRIACSEARLAESEHAYRGVVMNMLDVFFRVDADGMLSMISPSAAGLLGYDLANELLGKGTDTLWARPERRARLIAELQRTGEVRDWEIQARRKDGSEMDMSVSVHVLRDESGNFVGYEGIARDISERKMTEQALRSSEERYRNIIESIQEGYLELDLEGSLIFFNNSLSRMTGFSKEELRGIGYKELVPSETAARMSEVFHSICSTSQPRSLQDLEIVTKDGRILSIDLSASPIIGAEGRVEGYRGLFRDISDRKRSERQQQELEKQMLQVQKMEAIGALAGGVAHDLNNVLSGIVSYPDLILFKLPDDSPLRGPIKTIKESGIKAAAIVQDLLTLARRGVSVSEVVSLNDIVIKYLNSPEFLQLKAAHPLVRVTTELDDGLMNLMGSPVHLSKTIMNLVSNAAEAMPNGGNIAISTQNRYVDYPIRGYDRVKEGDYAVLTVSDCGMGINEEDQQRVFEPFFTKKRMGRSGTGLGMAVVWGAVKDHKGYIDIRSSEGRGTSFTLYFPITRKVKDEIQSVQAVERLKGSGEKVLVIDDVEQQRQIASAILSQLGYTVETACSGEEAVRYLRQGEVEILVLDMIMAPGMDGLETYRNILEFRPGQRAIITSGYSETDRVKEALRLGARRYLRKPYTIENLAMAVKEELPSQGAGRIRPDNA